LNANVLFCRLFFILSHPVYDQTQGSGAVFLLFHSGLRPWAPTSLYDSKLLNFLGTLRYWSSWVKKNQNLGLCY
jgi:hypothetical protein